MKIERIAILGGSGFVGMSLCNLLVKAGYALKVFTRRREPRRGNLILLPGLDLIELDVHDPDALAGGMAGCDAAINLVGILNEKGTDGAGFQRAHVELARTLLLACEKNGIQRILQMSALNADAGRGDSHYLRSKGQAEDLLHGNARDFAVTSFQPSVIFGRHDSFFNRLATLLQISPVLPLACPNARFAPVHVLDVAEMMVRALRDPKSRGKRFALCGPTAYTLLQLVQYTRQQLGISRLILPLPDGISRLQATMLDLLAPLFNAIGMQRPFSMDNYRSTWKDSVCTRNDLAVFGIDATALEAVVPTYVGGR